MFMQPTKLNLQMMIIIKNLKVESLNVKLIICSWEIFTLFYLYHNLKDKKITGIFVEE